MGSRPSEYSISSSSLSSFSSSSSISAVVTTATASSSCSSFSSNPPTVATADAPSERLKNRLSERVSTMTKRILQRAQTLTSSSCNAAAAAAAAAFDSDKARAEIKDSSKDSSLIDSPPSLLASTIFAPHLSDGKRLQALLLDMSRFDNRDPEFARLANKWMALCQAELDNIYTFARFASHQLEKGIVDEKAAITELSSPMLYGSNTTSFYLVRDFLERYNEANLADPLRFVPKNIPEDAIRSLNLSTHEGVAMDIRRRDIGYAVYWAQFSRKINLMCKKIPSKLLDRIMPLLIIIFRVERYLYLYYTYIDTQFPMLKCFLEELARLMSNPLSESSSPSTMVRACAALQVKLERKMTKCHRWLTTYLNDLKASLMAAKPCLDDYTCAICLAPYYKPITLQCSHKFCSPCIDQCLPTMPSSSSTSSSPNPATTPESETEKSDPTTPQKSCPLCRAHFHDDAVTRDTALANFLNLYFPREMQAKRRERKREELKEGFARLVTGPPVVAVGATGQVEHVYARMGPGDPDGRGFESVAFIAWPF